MRREWLLVGIGVLLSPGCSRPPESGHLPIPADYLQQEEGRRRARDDELSTDPYSRLALVKRYPLPGRQITIGSSPTADVHLEGDGVAPIHARIEDRKGEILLTALYGEAVWALAEPPGRITTAGLGDHAGFRIGRFNIRFIVHEDFGPLLEVYDPQIPALREFVALDYFPIDPSYRVKGEIVPYEKPEAVTLIDSQGGQRPYWVYGELRFRLAGSDCRLEVYTPRLEEVGRAEFMLMFQDKTSGEESYPAARYLYVEGKPQGEIVVDFNRAFSPPCNYSKVFSCPFPRPANRLAVAIRAGEKWYRATGQ